MRAQINAMLSGRGGSIVNIASNFGLVGQRGMPAYCASKHGVIGLSKSAVLDYADRGVRVNVVCPGPIGTPLLDSFLSNGGTEILDSIKLSVPMKRIGTSEEVAEAVAWLGSPETSYVTGAILSVDGGYVVP
jgi:NAD(P)-dependent dehydrogenase (short-subunit alcohol dehydrogenase family)